MIRSDFSYWALSAVKRHLEAAGQGTTFVELSRGRLRAIRIPVPDVSTQEAIAGFLDRETARLDQLIEKKQRLVALLDERRAAFVSDAVTGRHLQDAPMKPTNSRYLTEIPEHWSLRRLKQLGRVRGGITLGRAISEGRETLSVEYLRVANVQAGHIDLSDVATIEVTREERERYKLQKGDILMNEGGDNDKLGRGAVWDGSIDPCIHQNHVFAVRPFESHVGLWVSFCSNARYGRDFFYLNSRQSTNLASISKTRLEEFPVTTPPAEEMAQLIVQIADKTKACRQLIDQISESIAGLSEFRAALITAAVTGQIDVTTWHKRGGTDRRLDAIQEEMAS